MTYKIDGSEITLQPTTGKWDNREPIGIDGNGHAVYSAPREFEMNWGFMTMTEFSQLQGFFDAIGNTGTAVVSLPQYATTPWAFYDYTGCVLREPQVGQFFEEYVSSVKLLVVQIST